MIDFGREGQLKWIAGSVALSYWKMFAQCLMSGLWIVELINFFLVTEQPNPWFIEFPLDAY